MSYYTGKWVVVKRYPNAQNKYIGKVQCLFVKKETTNQIYGTESECGHFMHKYHKAEIVRIIDEKEKDDILQAQMHTRNNYSADLECLQRGYSIALDEIAEGTRTKPFLFLGEEDEHN